MRIIHRIAIAIALAFVAASPAAAQRSICGCDALPSLGPLDTRDAASLVATGATFSGGVLRIPLTPDGVMVLDSLYVDRAPAGAGVFWVDFVPDPNLPAPPITLLVRGDVTIGASTTIRLAGATGGTGSAAQAGPGGAPAPGGFRGGDGAYQLTQPGVAAGGAGFGPGGGAPGPLDPLGPGLDGVYLGNRELLPLVGGTGGGGGASSSDASGCAGGGGGGGGGAILIAANGTVTIEGRIDAAGGSAGSAGSFPCASGGGIGSGGAVRIVADRVEGGALIDVFGGGGASSLEGAGRVRIETNTLTMPASAVRPAGAASFDVAPGPIVNPIQPTVRIALVDGALPPDPALGALGRIDVVVEVPGPVPVRVATTDVPAGTDVELTIKPRTGGPAVIQTATLAPAACDTAGACIADLVPDLAAGNYVLEARATFTTP